MTTTSDQGLGGLDAGPAARSRPSPPRFYGPVGEIPAGAVTPRVADAGPALPAHYFLRHGAPIPDEVITSIVDEIVLPVLHRELA